MDKNSIDLSSFDIGKKNIGENCEENEEDDNNGLQISLLSWKKT